ncbi:hypothetical protein [Streptomyces phaeofaciens]|uniref:hypothetical protein n=1 Tax=Streptomyces phaeofaciens TaxID=68254 RepID=UPI0036BEA9C2
MVVEGEGLAVPEARHVVLAVLRVVQVEAVGGGGDVGACGELPPELGAFGAVGQVEQAGEGEGTGRLDARTLIDELGGTKGAVNRIKKIKRQLYGRAGCELLRKMILLQ